MKASRGDAIVIVIVSQESNYVTGAARTTSTRVELGIVTNITRDGLVKKFRAAAYQDSSPRTLDTVIGFQRTLVIPTSQISTQDVEAVARNHHFDGHPGQAKPFSSVDEAKAALKPYVIGADK